MDDQVPASVRQDARSALGQRDRHAVLAPLSSDSLDDPAFSRSTRRLLYQGADLLIEVEVGPCAVGAALAVHICPPALYSVLLRRAQSFQSTSTDASGRCCFLQVPRGCVSLVVRRAQAGAAVRTATSWTLV